MSDETQVLTEAVEAEATEVAPEVQGENAEQGEAAAEVAADED